MPETAPTICPSCGEDDTVDEEVCRCCGAVLVDPEPDPEETDHA